MKKLFAVLLTVLLAMSLTLTSFGASVTPESWNENQDPLPGECTAYKVDETEDLEPNITHRFYYKDLEIVGTNHLPEGAWVEIFVYETDDGWLVDWTSSVPVSMVYAKGGSGKGYTYTYEIAVTSDTGLYTPVNPSGKYAALSHITFYVCYIPPMECTTETAWAYDSLTGKALAFTDLGLKNWGWTNGGYGEGAYELDLYAGAGGNDLDKGTLVGTVTVEYVDGNVTVTYNLLAGYTMKEAHIWVGEEKLPTVGKGKNTKYTSAPGQFSHIAYFENGESYYSYDFEDVFEGEIYVAAHAVVCGLFGEATQEAVMSVQSVEEPTSNAGGRPATVELEDDKNFGEYISNIAKESPGAAAAKAPGQMKKN